MYKASQVSFYGNNLFPVVSFFCSSHGNMIKNLNIETLFLASINTLLNSLYVITKEQQIFLFKMLDPFTWPNINLQH